MRNLINTKRRTFWNTGLYTLLRVVAVLLAFAGLMLFWLSKEGLK